MNFPSHIQLHRSSLLWTGLSLASIGYMLVFLILASVRLLFPYELEWIEGAKIDQMRWILQGRPLYGPPDIHFIPFAYTPIFFYISTGLMKIVGVGFVAPRLISILATLGCFLVITLIVRQATGRVLPGVIGAGIYAACFQLTGAWMDLAKVDSLFMLLVLLAFFASLNAQKTPAMFLTGLFFALSYFTKQLALPLLLIYAPLTLLIWRGRNWPVWLTAFGLILGTYLIGDRLTDGWFSFYTLETVITHPRLAGWWPFWKSLLPKMLPSVLLLGVPLYQMRDIFRRKLPRLTHESWCVYGFIVALILTSWSIYFKIWTYFNDLLPACAGLAILAGLGAAQLYAPFDQNECAQNLPVRYARLAITILLSVQFILLVYNPLALAPAADQYRTGAEIVERTRNLPGEVLSFMHGYYNYLAGKETYLHTTPLGDVLVARFPPGTQASQRQAEVEKVYLQAIATQAFDWIVADKIYPGWLPAYVPNGDFIVDEGITFPGRGQSMAPGFLLKKNPYTSSGLTGAQFYLLSHHH